MDSTGRLTYKKLTAFFIPLGVAASLTSVTHVIINGTLSRGENGAFIVACFAVAMSVFGIIERPMIVFRQASSALVSGQKSFKLLKNFFIYILIIVLGISLILGYTPIGNWVYTNLFNATDDMVTAISYTFRVITFVIIFSGIRGIYQGVIINQLETKWLTIGVVARLVAMFIISYLLVTFDLITSAAGGAIFLVGMIVECLVSVYKGRLLIKDSKVETGHGQLKKADISRFYFPLVAYFLMQTILIPVIYILLAKSADIELSIASFALAFSITQMILGFFMYTHQLLLQFHGQNTRKVVKFVIMISIIPSLLLCVLCYTPIGMVFMTSIMGAEDSLSIATIAVLKFFIIKTLVFPWVDFLNGFLMLKRQTNKMLFAQIGNLIVVIITLLGLVHFYPALNGVNGSIAASLGELAGIVIVSIIVYRMSDMYKKKRYKRFRERRR
ncbi:hypothetical protein CIL05_00190 [Virgibacillus profundi]|uniref:Multi antimicrobial extrusion protein MatE n=1 Tax=Virgibacillus profundi TaxID=2024555 RepID=A0A2A2IIM6_9BACI|nr:multi antimicrobial extrusion protein MatE [Virgibacillus profundi]PAV31114.1 hypothetical protein CIL05_00190 [Virgibacillus profundi]PXY55297.1 multi antimicrobial extrusion protein MatE [Virgibacillus profundi]